MRAKAAPGGAAIDPAILSALWLYGVVEGIGNARALDRLTNTHDAYRWICGGVQVNYHALSDFRIEHGALSRKQVAARERVAREREERIQAALNCLPELKEIKQRQGKKVETARASRTDAEATVMKMGDGGFLPAYNTQFATDCESQMIVGVDVVNIGSDMGQLEPMVAQVTARCGRTADEWLIDGGYAKHEQIEAVSGKTTLYAPVPEPKQPKKAEAAGETQSAPDSETGTETNGKSSTAAPIDEHAPKASDSAGVAAWRARMGTDEAKTI